MATIVHIPWQVPFGEFSLMFDPLSLVFLAAMAILVICAGIYGIGYLREYQGKKPLALHWCFYLLLALSQVLVFTANNVILFLGAWEIMAISTYFLIVFHDEKPFVRKAGFLYLVATHCGTFCLFLMFFLMARNAGSMDLSVIARSGFSPALAGVIFVLAFFGFGVKAGIMPMHIWLPQAHPAAPSHVSALLSAIAIKTGIYGLCRVILIVGGLPEWCGYALLLSGIISGVMGVLYALGQHELKKLLAYHSVENIGIICVGLGLGLLGRSHHAPLLATIGFTGALLHVLNHALFKGLLFLAGGAVIQKTHTGEMDRLGGLAKVMPLTSGLFLVGALAICGLPLFNGFISEFIIFTGLFQGLSRLPLAGVFACSLGILSLALMGALALACFTKVYGTVFSGNPRDPLIQVKKEEPGKMMLAPMAAMAVICVWIGMAPETAVRFTFRAGAYLSLARTGSVAVEKLLTPLSVVIAGALIFCGLVLALVWLRRRLLGPEPAVVTETWGCGYSRPTARIQYTSSSFARPIVDFMRGLLGFHRHGGVAQGDFPPAAHMSSSVHDASDEKLFRPLFHSLTELSRKFDNSRIRYTQMYLMYIFIFLVFLLIWKLR